jgi:hypothetical protein
MNNIFAVLLEENSLETSGNRHFTSKIGGTLFLTNTFPIVQHLALVILGNSPLVKRRFSVICFSRPPSIKEGRRGGGFSL